jgi:hypothetical protein
MDWKDLFALKAAHSLEMSGAGPQSRMALYPNRLGAITVNKVGAQFSDAGGSDNGASSEIKRSVFP